jgi:hypothetical protein
VLYASDVTGAREVVRGRVRQGLTGAWTVARPTSQYRQRRADSTAAQRRRWHHGLPGGVSDGEAWMTSQARVARQQPVWRRLDNGGGTLGQ